MHILHYMSGDNRQSILHGIPIQYLDEIRRLFATDGMKIKVRYRGPRFHNAGRSWSSRQSTCLKVDAKTFAVYKR
jgi:hypothetical protein